MGTPRRVTDRVTPPRVFQPGSPGAAFDPISIVYPFIMFRHRGRDSLDRISLIQGSVVWRRKEQNIGILPAAVPTPARAMCVCVCVRVCVRARSRTTLIGRLLLLCH